MVIARAPKESAKACVAKVATQDTLIYSGGTHFLTFRAGGTDFALYIVATKAIVDAPHVKPDPRLPEFVKGTISVEGHQIPVIDLASRLGFPAARSAQRSCVVVVKAQLFEQTLDLGVEVDHVHDVLNLSHLQGDAPPTCGDNLNSHFMDVMARLSGHYAMVMHAEQLLFSDELVELISLGEQQDELVHH